MGYFEWHEQPGYYNDVVARFPGDVTLLDLGCGTGWLADHFPDYTGIDDSADAVALARAKGRQVLLGDASEPLPFEDGSFGGVVLKDLLEHVADPVAVVREAHRVLAPGGVVFASSPDAQRWVWDDYTHRRPFTRKAFRLLFADQGFLEVRAGYESVMPGTGLVSARLLGHRRPLFLRWAAWLPVVRRNVWVTARR